ncbi:elongation of very long chain fatty acids protein, partial [Caerostris extrusa]
MFTTKALVKNPQLPCTIVGIYVLLVTWIGPALMRSRKPYNLQKVLIVYNFVQAIANSYIAYNAIVGLYEFWDDRCLVKKSPKFPIIFQSFHKTRKEEDRANRHKPLMRSPCLEFHIKLCHQNEGCWFSSSCAKKQSQFLFLHVFHHAGMCLLFFWGLNSLHKTS